MQNHIDQTLEQLKRGDVRGKIRRPGLSKTAEGGKRVQFAIPDGSRTVAAMEVNNMEFLNVGRILRKLLKQVFYPLLITCFLTT